MSPARPCAAQEHVVFLPAPRGQVEDEQLRVGIVTNMRWLVATAACAGMVLGGQAPAHATEETPDTITESSIVGLSESQVEQGLTDAEHPESGLERRAVENYLNDLPDEGSYVTAQDLRVGTLEVTDDLTATIVVPEAVSVEEVAVQSDAGSNEVSATAELALPEAMATTTGPGMGNWPNWEDSPSWVLRINLYLKGNYIGKAVFQTQRRKYANDGNSYRDTWQVARRAVATPDEYEYDNFPDAHAYVKQLWISSGLAPEGAVHAQQWRQDLTTPDEGFSACSSNVTFTIPPYFSFTPSNCADYDVYQGDVGYQRFNYDQGAWAGGEARAIAYISGFQMDNGATPYAKWYEFVTLRLGHLAGDPEYKCSSTAYGAQYDTMTQECRW